MKREFCKIHNYKLKLNIGNCLNNIFRNFKVREMRLVNSNPDRPSNFPHFCQPIDSAISDRRQREREVKEMSQFLQYT